ncbi:hypothetical protein [Methylobacterium platani]|uniref:hypothetical protein n=1 Tax=Methylobacterium platani TaxID=427683 RepID=UPI0006529561|nr:hypothetical protein [Methylobacterium platani]
MKRAAVLAASLIVPVALPSPARAAPEAAPACAAPQAAAFAGGKGFRLWVTRQGTMSVTNPLRPLSPETVQVLQVVIRNKIATAYGPDLSGLRRGPSPAALEAQNAATIRWADGPEGLPPTLRILADDGGQVLAELRFEACGDAPKVAEPKVAGPRPPKPVPTARKGKPKPDAAAQATDPAADPAAEPAATTPPRAQKPKRERAAAPADAPSRTPGGLVLPQGAIP